jgi:hypothetical protein
VLVKEEDYENAQLILQKGGYLNPEKVAKVEVVYLTDATNKTQCPFCHSENIGKRKDPALLMLFVSIIIGMITPIVKRTDMCFDCGKEWKYKKIKNEK